MFLLPKEFESLLECVQFQIYQRISHYLSHIKLFHEFQLICYHQDILHMSHLEF